MIYFLIYGHMCAYNYIYIRAVCIQTRILLYWNFHDFSIHHVAIIMNDYKTTAQRLGHILCIWQINFVYQLPHHLSYLL